MKCSSCFFPKPSLSALVDSALLQSPWPSLLRPILIQFGRVISDYAVLVNCYRSTSSIVEIGHHGFKCLIDGFIFMFALYAVLPEGVFNFAYFLESLSFGCFDSPDLVVPRMSRSHPGRFADWPQARRSGCLPAEPYPSAWFWHFPCCRLASQAKNPLPGRARSEKRRLGKTIQNG